MICWREGLPLLISNNPFENIGFEDFKRFAKDKNLSKYERIGFPDDYRRDFEATIFSDIRQKLPNLELRGKQVLDIGPGCSDLPRLEMDLCREHGHHLTLIDSSEMLSLVPDESFIEKISGLFPYCEELVLKSKGKMDVILCYSVIHYAIVETPIFRFLDTALALLAPGGQMLIGDVPNVSKRKRFFASEKGIEFHQQFMKTSDKPEVEFNRIEQDKIDDAVIFSLTQRARTAGFDAYIIPQDSALPLANRREDILIVRP
jgi:2-polyprenyl-3-methyl-5-hydroxy-6-metoxy-1,4-benzoquinol methylase